MGEMETTVEVREQATAWEIALEWYAACLPSAFQIRPPPSPILLSTSKAGLYRLQPRVPLPSNFQLGPSNGKP